MDLALWFYGRIQQGILIYPMWSLCLCTYHPSVCGHYFVCLIILFFIILHGSGKYWEELNNHYSMGGQRILTSWLLTSSYVRCRFLSLVGLGSWLKPQHIEGDDDWKWRRTSAPTEEMELPVDCQACPYFPPTEPLNTGWESAIRCLFCFYPQWFSFSLWI